MAGSPSGPVVGTSTRCPDIATASTSRNPGPPSANGRTVTASAGAAASQPSAIAAAAAGAETVPANLSGHTRTRTTPSLAAHNSGSARVGDRLWRLCNDRLMTTFVERSGTAAALLLLGRGRDASSERGVDCPGDLPAPSDPTLVARAQAAKAALGERLFILGHHYQRDEVIQFADVTGDSFKLAKDAAARPAAEFIVFCGVHFMAESADILTSPDQKVILPDLAAGCSMGHM